MGLIIFVIFSMQGLVMGARMAHTVVGADGSIGLPVTNWSIPFGDLRIAHFLGMHALQVLLLLGFYVFKNTRGVVFVSILYAVMVVAKFVQAVRGKPLIAQGFLSWLKQLKLFPYSLNHLRIRILKR
jgi:hypothetical protein